MKSLVFVTGNKYKFEVAKKALGLSGIELIQEEIDTPEIQSIDVKEVASYSAKWSANKLLKPVVVTDSGYYIEALNGFPGPFIKYINNWFTANDFIKLMEGKTNRKAEIKISVAYCDPGGEPISFTTNAFGVIAEKSGDGRDSKFAIDQVFIPEGFDRVISELPREVMVNYWVSKENYWNKLAEYLLSKDAGHI